MVDPEDSLLSCMRYIDSHPQRSGLVRANAADYAWSSCAHHLGRRRDALIVDHARYWALGNTPFEREGAFRSFLDEGVSLREAQAISQATRRGWPIAGAAGQQRLATQLGRDIVPRPRGSAAPRKLLPDALLLAPGGTAVRTRLGRAFRAARQREDLRSPKPESLGRHRMSHEQGFTSAKVLIAFRPMQSNYGPIILHHDNAVGTVNLY